MEYQPCDYKLGKITRYDNAEYSKSDTFYFVNKKRGIIVQLRNNQGNGIGGNSLCVSSNWYSPSTRLLRKSEPEYEFENYFTSKALKKFDFTLIESSSIKSALLLAKIVPHKNKEISDGNQNTVVVVGLKDRTLPYFERVILDRKIPVGEGIQTKYDDKQWRLITWKGGTSSKIYNYSMEKMDMLGYEFVKVSISDNRHKVYVYRNCKKSLIFEVTEWFNERILILDLKWYDKNIKNKIGYLMFCDLK